MKQWKAWVLLVVISIGAGCSSFSGVNKDNLAHAHYNLGLSYLNNNQLQRAYVEFQKSIEAVPNYRNSHYALGHIFFQQDKLNKAEQSFLITIKADKRFSDAHNYLGKVYERKGNPEKAIIHYNEALKNPQYATPHFTHYNLGALLMKADDADGALLAFEEAARIDPTFSPAHLGMGQALNQLSRYDLAIVSLNHMIKLDPGNPQAYFSLGVAHYNEGSNAQAKKAFEKTLEIFPEGDLADRSRQYIDLLR